MNRTRCRCGHLRHTHQHYRRGTGCAVCTCARWRRVPLLDQLAVFLGYRRRLTP